MFKNKNISLATLVAITLPLATFLTLNPVRITRTNPSNQHQSNTSNQVFIENQITEEINTEAPSIKQETNNEMAEPTGISRSNLPSPEERVPGTPLNESVKDALNIEEDIESEAIFFTSLAPNDPTYPQWYTTVIDAPLAWDRTTGSSDVLVAVIDTGYGLEHEELADSWFINSGETGMTESGDTCWSGSPQDKQTNGCDDDQNSLTDDWRGWDFSNADNNPQAGDNYAPGSTHGTKSAGLVAGRGNNNLGTAAVNWGAKILPIQALFDEGFGYSSDIANAIYYATEMGADVINMSLGGAEPDSYTLAAIQYAERNNVIVVAAAGNCGDEQISDVCSGTPSPGGMEYPGRYAETIAVGATRSNDQRASFSSWGDELTITAPGSGTIATPSWSTTNGVSTYDGSSYGTSFASPIVAGAVALVKGEFPDISRGEVVALLSNSADKVSGMSGNNWHAEYGYGRLNVAQLLNEMDRYKTQLQKYGGQISEISADMKPLVSTNKGHIASKQITNSDTIQSVCVTTPNTECSLILDKQGSSTQINFGTKLSNNQGIATFSWSRSNLNNPSGTWDALVTSNAQTSLRETLIIQ